MSQVVPFDFFQARCLKGPYSQQRFGIFDVPGAAADVDTQDESAWIATIHNEKQLAVMFTAIDGCVFPHSKGGKRCDAMLTTENSLHLIELKNRKKPEAFKDGRAQLIATIEALRATCDVTQFKVRRAHVCNRRKPDYKSNESERDFRAQYQFVLLHKADVFITE